MKTKPFTASSVRAIHDGPIKMIEIPCITMYGPWAHWVELEWKTIETRTHDRFRCLIGRRIGIHVAQHWDTDGSRLAWHYMTPDQRAASSLLDLRKGHVICTARVALCEWLTARHSESAMIDCHNTGRFGLHLVDVKKLPTCPETKFAGKQGIWKAVLPTHLVYTFKKVEAAK